MQYRYLSHVLKAYLPIYGNPDGKLEIRITKSISAGDSSNTYWFGMSNHWGTHVDAPAHFFNGRASKTHEFPAGTWVFKKPQVLKVHLKPGELLSRKHFRTAIRRTTDFLLFQSGWSLKRQRPEYSLENPGIHPEVGEWLRAQYPNLRAVGLDWISLSSYRHREEGRQTHRIFLNPLPPGKPILVFEDMDLTENLSRLRQVWAFPLRMEVIDSAPCTVVGVFQ